MTTIPTIERIEESQCSACSQNCTRLCVSCGTYFCNRHLLAHSGKCSHKYYEVVKAILHDGFADALKNLLTYAVPNL